MKKLYIFIIACLLAVPAAAGNLLYGPWVTNIGENGFNVLWITEQPSLDWVEVAPDDGTAFEAMMRPKYYQTSHGRRTSGRYHCVRVDNLEPGTSYRYRIVGRILTDATSPYRLDFGATVRVSPKGTMSVRTLDSKADACRFSVMNDIHFQMPALRRYLPASTSRIRISSSLTAISCRMHRI